METDFPPLPPPRSDGTASSGHAATHRGMANGFANGSVNGRDATSPGRIQSQSGTDTRVVAEDSDVVLYWFEPSPPPASSRSSPRDVLFHVPATALAQMNPYFATLFDPRKFSEGRILVDKTNQLIEKYGSQMRGRLDQVEFEDLPRVDVEGSGMIAKNISEADVFEFFLKMLICVGESQEKKKEFLKELALKPVSFLASLIVVANRFNGQDVLKALMAESRCAVNLTKDKLLKPVNMKGARQSNEERIRQALYIGLFLDHHRVTRAMSHALITVGSKAWFYADDEAGIQAQRPAWWNFPEGIEEELYYRHQCILHTIVDLQTHFLSVYGALDYPVEQETVSSPKSPASNSTTRSTTTRPIQCRWGSGNSIACDSFHLGEFIRFLSIRTGTLSLGSTLIDPDLDEGSGVPPDFPNSFLSRSGSSGIVGTPTDINNLLAALRQCPDYQIDPSHSSCGIRRRLNPLLDYIELFSKSEHTVGLCLTRWRELVETESWKSQRTMGTGAVNVSHSKMIDSIMCPASDYDRIYVPICQLCDRSNKKGRTLFTATRRIWDS